MEAETGLISFHFSHLRSCFHDVKSGAKPPAQPDDHGANAGSNLDAAAVPLMTFSNIF
jgi:hypothetical protein